MWNTALVDPETLEVILKDYWGSNTITINAHFYIRGRGKPGHYPIVDEDEVANIANEAVHKVRREIREETKDEPRLPSPTEEEIREWKKRKMTENWVSERSAALEAENEELKARNELLKSQLWGIKQQATEYMGRVYTFPLQDIIQCFRLLVDEIPHDIDSVSKKFSERYRLLEDIAREAYEFCDSLRFDLTPNEIDLMDSVRKLKEFDANG